MVLPLETSAPTATPADRGDDDRGDVKLLAELLPLAYDELRALADHLLRDRPRAGTPQTTSLVHEAYLRLVHRGNLPCRSRAHWLGLACKAMRCVLVDHLRRQRAAKRGGGWGHLTLEEASMVPEKPKDPDPLALHEALTRLAGIDARMGQIVELRFFGGLTVEETAEVLGVSPSSIKRDWRIARAWLYGQLSKE